jgi:DNA helicase-2/ATP-dependent DNA helicase PcrA
VRFRDPDDEASGLVEEIVRRRAQGLDRHNMAILYRGNALSRLFEEALVRTRILYTIIGDVGFYQRAETRMRLPCCVSSPRQTTGRATKRCGV